MVKGILADVNIQGHVDLLFDLLTSDAWLEFWQALGTEYATFSDVGLVPEAADAAVWQVCQDQGYVLITRNRNRKGTDSLEATIRARNTTECLPVLTIADADRFLNDRKYADDVVASLLQILFDIDSLRGTGRLYLPFYLS